MSVLGPTRQPEPMRNAQIFLIWLEAMSLLNILPNTFKTIDLLTNLSYS